MTQQRHALRSKRYRRFKHTVSWRADRYDRERIELVFRKYHVPWGISRSSRFRALFRILAAKSEERELRHIVAALDAKWSI